MISSPHCTASPPMPPPPPKGGGLARRPRGSLPPYLGQRALGRRTRGPTVLKPIWRVRRRVTFRGRLHHHHLPRRRRPPPACLFLAPHHPPPALPPPFPRLPPARRLSVWTMSWASSSSRHHRGMRSSPPSSSCSRWAPSTRLARSQSMGASRLRPFCVPFASRLHPVHSRLPPLPPLPSIPHEPARVLTNDPPQCWHAHVEAAARAELLQGAARRGHLRLCLVDALAHRCAFPPTAARGPRPRPHPSRLPAHLPAPLPAPLPALPALQA